MLAFFYIFRSVPYYFIMIFIMRSRAGEKPFFKLLPNFVNGFPMRGNDTIEASIFNIIPPCWLCTNMPGFLSDVLMHAAVYRDFFGF